MWQAYRGTNEMFKPFEMLFDNVVRDVDFGQLCYIGILGGHRSSLVDFVFI